MRVLLPAVRGFPPGAASSSAAAPLPESSAAPPTENDVRLPSHAPPSKRRRLDECGPDPTAKLLVEKIGQGEMHTTTANEIACSLLNSGHSPSALRVLAEIGTGGKHPQNLERDLLTRVQHHHGFKIEPYWIKITLWNADKLGSSVQSVPVLLPFELYAAAWQAGWKQFERSAVGPGGVEVFALYWKNAMRQPWGQRHPLFAMPEMFAFAVPLAYFVDGAEFSNGSSATVTSVASVAAGRGNAYDKSFLISVLPEDRLVKHVSMRELGHFLAWCGDVLLSGRRPERGYHGEEFPQDSQRHRMRGQPIAANYIFAFAAMLCDNKQKNESHHFGGRNWASRFVCEECFASKRIEEFNAFDHSTNARWRDTLVDHEKYLLQTPPPFQSPWLRHPGWSLDRNVRDLMHNVFIGTGNDICASIVKELCDEGMFPGAGLDE